MRRLCLYFFSVLFSVDGKSKQIFKERKIRSFIGLRYKQSHYVYQIVRDTSPHNLPLYGMH